MSSVMTGQMSAVETGQMSAAETGQMSAVETRQMSVLRQGRTKKAPKSDHSAADVLKKVKKTLHENAVRRSSP